MMRMLSITIVLSICMSNVHAMGYLKCFRGERRVEPYNSSRAAYTYETESNKTEVHPGVLVATISPDNTQVLSVARNLVIVKTLIDTQAPTRYEGCGGSYAAFSSDGRKAVIGKECSAKTVWWDEPRGFEVLDLVQGKRSQRYLSNLNLAFLAFTPDSGKIIAVHSRHSNMWTGNVTAEAGVKVIDYTTGQIKHAINLKEDEPEICFLRNSILYALFGSSRAQRMNVNTYADLPDVVYRGGIVKHCVYGSTIPIKCTAASIDKMAIISTEKKDNDVQSGCDFIRIHDLDSGNLVSTICPDKNVEGPGGLFCKDDDSLYNLGPIAISPDGAKLVFGAHWCCKKETLGALHRKNNPFVVCVAGLAGNSGMITHRIPEFIYPVLSMIFSSDNRFVFVRNNRSRIIDTETGTEVWGNKDEYGSGEFSLDGTTAVITASDSIQVVKKKLALKN